MSEGGTRTHHDFHACPLKHVTRIQTEPRALILPRDICWGKKITNACARWQGSSSRSKREWSSHQHPGCPVWPARCRGETGSRVAHPPTLGTGRPAPGPKAVPLLQLSYFICFSPSLTFAKHTPKEMPSRSFTPMQGVCSLVLGGIS